MVRIFITKGRADICPVVAQRRLDLLLGRDDQLSLLADEIQERAEALNRKQLGDVRTLGPRSPQRR